MAKKSHLSAPKWIKWLQDWQASHNDEDQVVDEVNAAIAGTDILGVSIESHFIAPYYAVRGAIQLWQGEQSGWNDVAAFFAIEASRVATHICFLDEMIAKRGGKYIDGKMGVAQLQWIAMNSATLMQMTAEAFERSVFAQWLGDRLRQSVLTNDLLVSYPWKQADFERSWVKVIHVMHGGSISEADNIFGRQGAFQSILSSWNDEKAFGLALSQLCDFHLDNCRSDSHVFATLPFPFFPVEILAMLSMRRQLGILTPPPLHSLMETPFAQIPRQMPWLDSDHLARRVVARCAREYPVIASILS